MFAAYSAVDDSTMITLTWLPANSWPDCLRPRRRARPAVARARGRWAVGGRLRDQLPAALHGTRRVGRGRLRSAPSIRKPLRVRGAGVLARSWTCGRRTRGAAAGARRQRRRADAFVEDAVTATSTATRASSKAGCEAVALLPHPQRFLAVVIDACRTNILPLFEAVACENPYPGPSLPRAQLQPDGPEGALQRTSRLRASSACQTRLNSDLARMAADYAAERRAAGRSVPVDIGLAHDRRRRPRSDAMKIIDPHVHMTSRTTDDYEAMAAAGIVAIVEPAFWLGQPRTTRRQLRRLLQQPARLGALPRLAVRHPALLHDGPQPQGSQQPQARRRGARRCCRAFWTRTASWRSAKSASTIRPTPRRRCCRGRSSWRASSSCRCSCTRRIATRSRARSARSSSFESLRFPEERVLIDHNNEETLPIVLDTGCWAGHSIYPNTKMDEQRMAALVKKYGSDRIIVNSAADWGISDPLKVPKTIEVMREQRHRRRDDRADRLGQPGRLLRARAAGSTSPTWTTPPAIDRSQKFEDELVLRGERAQVEPLTPRCTRPRSSTSSGSPRRCSAPDTPHLNALARDGVVCARPRRAARRDLHRAGHLPHRHAAARPRHRRQRLVLPRPRAGDVLAAGEPAGARREGLGDRPPPRPVVHLRARCSGGSTCTARADWSVTPRPIYPADGRKILEIYSSSRRRCAIA